MTTPPVTRPLLSACFASPAANDLYIGDPESVDGGFYCQDSRAGVGDGRRLFQEDPIYDCCCDADTPGVCTAAEDAATRRLQEESAPLLGGLLAVFSSPMYLLNVLTRRFIDNGAITCPERATAA